MPDKLKDIFLKHLSRFLLVDEEREEHDYMLPCRRKFFEDKMKNINALKNLEAKKSLYMKTKIYSNTQYSSGEEFFPVVANNRVRFYKKTNKQRGDKRPDASVLAAKNILGGMVRFIETDIKYKQVFI